MIRGVLLLVLVLSMPLVSSLSQPITVPVIVKLGNDEAINIAIDNLRDSLKNSIVLEFGSIGYYLSI